MLSAVFFGMLRILLMLFQIDLLDKSKNQILEESKNQILTEQTKMLISVISLINVYIIIYVHKDSYNLYKI